MSGPIAGSAKLTPESAALRIDLIIRHIHRLPVSTFEAEAAVLNSVVDELLSLKRQVLGAE